MRKDGTWPTDFSGPAACRFWTYQGGLLRSCIWPNAEPLPAAKLNLRNEAHVDIDEKLAYYKFVWIHCDKDPATFAEQVRDRMLRDSRPLPSPSPLPTNNKKKKQRQQPQQQQKKESRKRKREKSSSSSDSSSSSSSVSSDSSSSSSDDDDERPTKRARQEDDEKGVNGPDGSAAMEMVDFGAEALFSLSSATGGDDLAPAPASQLLPLLPPATNAPSFGMESHAREVLQRVYQELTVPGDNHSQVAGFKILLLAGLAYRVGYVYEQLLALVDRELGPARQAEGKLAMALAIANNPPRNVNLLQEHARMVQKAVEAAAPEVNLIALVALERHFREEGTRVLDDLSACMLTIAPFAGFGRNIQNVSFIEVARGQQRDSFLTTREKEELGLPTALTVADLTHRPSPTAFLAWLEKIQPMFPQETAPDDAFATMTTLLHQRPNLFYV
jgi:hypothetical protein